MVTERVEPAVTEMGSAFNVDIVDQFACFDLIRACGNRVECEGATERRNGGEGRDAHVSAVDTDAVVADGACHGTRHLDAHPAADLSVLIRLGPIDHLLRVAIQAALHTVSTTCVGESQKSMLLGDTA